MAGKREITANPGIRPAVLIACGVIIILLCAYLGFSFWLGQRDILYPNVMVGSLNVGGLSPSAAQEAVIQQVAQSGEGTLSAAVRYEQWTGAVSVQNVRLGEFSADTAYRTVQEGLLTRGARYLAHLMGSATPIVPVVLLDARGEQELNDLLVEVEDQLSGAVVEPAWRVEGEQLILTKGVTGMGFDRDEIRSDVLTALTAALLARLGASPADELRLNAAHITRVPPQEPDMNAIRAEIHTAAISATLDLKTFEVSDHVVGLELDTEQALAAYQRAQEGQTVSVPLIVTKPQQMREDFESKLFRDILGQATSEVGGSANRKQNVKRSADACSNIILMPGDEFSYNNTTGSRSAAAGYLPAPVYVAGKTEEEIGGGICQTSSTIYYALLHTDLEIVERHKHMFAVGYVPDGTDATVYFGSLDFRFKNDTEYPVKLVAETYDKGGTRYLTVTLYGTKTDDVTIKVDRVRSDFVSEPVQYVADPNVPAGTTVQEQSPYMGRRSTVYRYFYNADGTLIKTENLGSNIYRSRAEIRLYNPVDAVSLGLAPATTPPGTTDPGTANPGTTDPGTTNPGIADPGTANPGTTDPGTTNPGTTDPGTANPGTADPIPPDEHDINDETGLPHGF